MAAAFGLDLTTLLADKHDVGRASEHQATPTKGKAPGNYVTAEMVDKVLVKEAEEAGLVATETWLAKVREIVLLDQLTNRHSESH